MFTSLLLLASLAIPSIAAPLTGAQFRDFSGGLNDSTDASILTPNQSPDLLNLIIDDPVGSAKPRGGYTTCGKLQSGNTPTEMYTYSKSDGSQFLIVADNTNVYQTSDCASWKRIVTGQSSTNKPNFRTVRNELWFVNGSTWAYKWDGSTTTIIDGRSDTPNPAPPRGRYIEFWRERVWIARTSDNPSVVQWSALTDSAGNDITPSTGTGAWPATNAIYVDRDGGSPIYGIKAYRDNLYIFKDNGIWRLSFNNDFDLSVQKTLSSVGCRFGSSIVELDNLLYFVGPDGIYSFDGDNSVRLSDKIYNTFLSIQQPLTAEGTKIWTNKSDFEAGAVINSTSTAVPGSVVLVGTVGLTTNGGFETGSISPWTCVTIGVGKCLVETGAAITGAYGAVVTSEGTLFDASLYVFDISGATVASASSVPGYSVDAYSVNTSSGAGRLGYLHFTSINTTGGEAHLYSPIITIGSIVTYNAGSTIGLGYGRLDDISVTVYGATGTWTSETYEAVGLSSWSVFDAESRTNGGSLSYQVRVGSSALNVSTATWSDILAGGLIPGATWENFIQVRSTLTAPASLQNTPYLDSISISFLKGGSQTQTIYGGRWRNRYWMSANSNDFESTKSNTEDWDTASDWVSGTLIQIDTSTVDGFMIAGGTKLLHDNFTDANHTTAPHWDPYPASTWTVAGSVLRCKGSGINNTNTITSSNTMATGEWIFQHSYDHDNSSILPGGNGTNNIGMVFQFVDNSTSATSPTDVATGGAYFVQIKNQITSSTDHVITLSSSATNNISASRGVALASHTLSSYAADSTTHNYRITRDYTGLMAVYYNGTKILEATDTSISSSTRLVIAANVQESGGGLIYQDFDNIFYRRSSSGSWVSPVVHIDGNIDYGIFYGDKTESDGTVTFMMRASTSEASLYQTAFTSFSNGQEITFDYQKEYFQTSAFIFSDTSRQFVSSISVTYVQRTQQVDNNNNLVLVAGRNDKSAWVPYDMMIGPMTVFNDRFYVGSSTGSSVYRMDYGTNDSGQVIPWYWTSRDEAWGQPLNRKRLMEIGTDYRKASGASAVNIGYSGDNGATFTNSSISMDGTGRATDVRYVNGQNKFDYRLRFGSTSLDVAPTIIGITGWSTIYPGRN